MPAIRLLVTVLVILPLLAAQDPPAPPPVSPTEQRALRSNQAGIEFYETQRYDDAVSRFEEARALWPKTEAFTRNLARALHARGVERAGESRLADAVHDLNRAFDLDSGEVVIGLSLARVHGLAGDALLQRSRLVDLLELHPGDGRVHEAMGRLEYEEENLQRAVEFLETAAKLDPERAASFKPFLEKVRREAKVEGRYFREERGVFSVKYDDEAFRDVSQAILDILDHHYNGIGSDLQHWPRRRVIVVLYTRQDYDRATGALNWTGGLFDGTKIRLPVRNFRRDRRTIEAAIAHELTHFFVRSLAPRCPTWLDEGVAQIREGRPPERERARLRAALSAGRLKRISELPTSWSSIKDAETARLYYAQALSFTDYLVRRYGWNAVAALLNSLGRGAAWRPLFTAAFAQDVDRVEDDWRLDL